MIVLFTDFGLSGPYIGQMQAAIFRVSPEARMINLFANAPSFNPVAAAHLLSAYGEGFPPSTVFLAVVDPGVGSQRRPVVAEIDGQHFVGPDNALFDVVASRSNSAELREIVWRPNHLSNSFHGRDLFAPVAAHIDNQTIPSDWLSEPISYAKQSAVGDLKEIIYLDDYGNAMTGVRASQMNVRAKIVVGGQTLMNARIFSDVEAGSPFWYYNSNGLVEMAVNCGSAARQLDLRIGTPFEVVKPS